jgi:hypothetical protein
MSTQAEVEPKMAVQGPLLEADGLIFWEGSREGCFVIQRHPDTQGLIWPPRPMSGGANNGRQSGSKSRVVVESGPSSYVSPISPGLRGGRAVQREDPTIRFVGNLVAYEGARLDSVDQSTTEIGLPGSAVLTASSGPAIDSSGG